MSFIRRLLTRLGLVPRVFDLRCTDCDDRLPASETRVHRVLRRGCPLCGGNLLGPSPGDPDYRDYVRALRGADTDRFDDPHAPRRGDGS